MKKNAVVNAEQFMQNHRQELVVDVCAVCVCYKRRNSGGLGEDDAGSSSISEQIQSLPIVISHNPLNL